ncbi:unnamed protein product, partial [Chrysoparadoxa australica]
WIRRRSSTSSPEKMGRRSSTSSPNKSPTKDRFIPERSAMDLDVCRHLLYLEEGETMAGAKSTMSTPRGEKQQQFNKAVRGVLLDDSGQDSRILAFKERPPTLRDEYAQVLYRPSPAIKSGKIQPVSRHLPSSPSRILDAPDLVDDYYLNLISWGSNNVVAVALGQSVYLWQADTGAIKHLVQLDADQDYVTSVRWMDSGSHLAVGTNSCAVQIWDTSCMRQVRSMGGHTARVSSLAWNGPLVSSGSRDSKIIQHDVRNPRHIVSKYTGHDQEVCGLAWSPDGLTLASGGNENLLCLWDINMTGQRWHNDNGSEHRPRSQMRHHRAAVKALAWCPMNRHLLASGGGTADRTIKFWNTSNAQMLNSIDTGSQVCSLLWSRHHKELVSSHGYSENQLCLWRYPSISKIKEFKGHTARVLHLDQNPSGSTVV